MRKNILVGYATWAGSTREVAEHIGKELGGPEIQVTLQALAEVRSLDEYDGVVIGTPVHATSLHPEARSFVRRFTKVLPQKKVAYFLVCLTMGEDTPENRAAAMKFIDPLLLASPEVKPLSLGLFGGAMFPEKIQGIWKFMFRNQPPQDRRDWNAITRWARELKQLLG